VKRRIFAMLLCAAVLICAAVPVSPALASTNVYFMASNNTIYPSALDDSNMPIIQGGAFYVPYRLFDSATTGSELGTYCIYNQGQSTLVIYTRDLMLTFHISDGTVNDKQGNSYSFYAITRNNNIYVPVSKVASFFGLEYYPIPTDYGMVIRVRNDAAILTNEQFIETAGDLKLKPMLQEYEQKKQSGSGTNSSGSQGSNSNTTGTTTGSQGNTETDTASNAISVQMGFRVESDSGLDDLTALLNNRNLTAIFFFNPKDLSKYDDQIRSLIGKGNQVGFLISEDQSTDAETMGKALDEDNELLRQIAQVHTYFLLTDGSNESINQTLDKAGWLRWTGAITGSSAKAIVSEVNKKAASVRLTLTVSSTTASLTEKVLNRLPADQFVIRPVRETDFVS
jgi:hypothetical protein